MAIESTTVGQILRRNLNEVLPGAQWANKLNIYVDNKNYAVKIDAPGYTKYMNEGRGPGKRPPMEAMKTWLKEKGIAESAYWAIANKIAESGTKGIGDAWMDESLSEIADQIFGSVTDDIGKIITGK